MQKFLLGLILGSLVGGYAANLFFQRPKENSETGFLIESQTQNQLTERASEISALAEGPEKTAKIDQFLGELMKAMMISVKLRMDTAACALPAAAEGVTAIKTEGAQAPDQNANPSAASITNASNASPSTPSEGATEVTPKLTTTVVDTKALAKKVNSLSDPAQALDLLRKHASTDLGAALDLAHKTEPADLQYLLGRFEGELRYLNNKQPSAGVVISMRMVGSSKNDIAYEISLSRNGKIFDRSSGKGSAKHFLTNGSQGPIYVEHGGDESQIEIYYLPTMDAWVGNAYRSKGRGKWELAGQVSLSRN